jgi:hypothetical protein
MALFSGNLEDVLGQQADTQAMGIQQGYVKKRRQLAGQQAAGGRLGSGVANYPMADVDSAELGDLSGVYSGLAQSLGQIPAQGYADDQEYARNTQLAELIAKMNKPSKLSQALGGVGVALKGASTFASMKGAG